MDEKAKENIKGKHLAKFAVQKIRHEVPRCALCTHYHENSTFYFQKKFQNRNIFFNIYLLFSTTINILVEVHLLGAFY